MTLVRIYSKTDSALMARSAALHTLQNNWECMRNQISFLPITEEAPDGRDRTRCTGGGMSNPLDVLADGMALAFLIRSSGSVDGAVFISQSARTLSIKKLQFLTEISQTSILIVFRTQFVL